jgi:amino acid adenylation domain-containing protein
MRYTIVEFFMELKTRLESPHESFWRSLFSDLQSTGLLRGNSTQTLDREATFNAQTQLPLAVAGLFHPRTRTETVLLAAWAVVLARHTSSTDVIFFSSFNDQRPWLAPLRVVLPAKRPVSEWLVEFENELRKAEESGPIPGHIMAQAREEGLARSLPTFLVVPPEARAFPPRDQIKGPLLIVVRLDISMIEIHYDSAWFDQTDVQILGDHLNVVLQGMAAAPQSAVGNLPVLTAQERHQLLDQWNDTSAPFAENTCIHEFFEEQAARTPEAVAVVFCDRQWTYRELNAQAEVLASRLRSAGVGPGTFVAICLNRSLELMAALLAVFKAGGAYVPLDPAYPAERLTFMIDDAKPAVIVVSKQTADLFPLPEQRLFWVDGAGDKAGHEAIHKSPVPPQSSDAAYVLYTSGSTGKPKGVIVTHRNVANFFTAMDAVIGTEAGVWLAVTSVNFDISVFELFWTLARGFRIILQEEGQWASQTGLKYSLPAQMRRHGVTHFQCTPSLASMLICDAEAVNALAPLRRFMIGGEPLPLDLAHRLSEIIAGDLFNLYGPTETTVWSAAQRISRLEKQILIGRPVANTRLYVLDAERELVPIGSVGELYIGGDGLAREYLNRPDVTRERFVTHTFSPARTERLYRTGDLVRHTRDGRLEFMGRIDQQIKIRGIRIELGEIEVVLREHPDVRDAVVVVQEIEADDKRLVAYVVPSSSQPPSVSQMQKWLGSKLPQMLVPSALIFLPEFPKTPNGKLDRRALPKPDRKTPQVNPGAANDLERQIAAIWSEALGVQSVGLEERFFDIGGHSLLMIEVHDQLRDKTGHRVALLDLFQYPTVRSLAHHLGQRSAEVASEATGLKRGKLRQQLAGQRNPIRKTSRLKKPS